MPVAFYLAFDVTTYHLHFSGVIPSLFVHLSLSLCKHVYMYLCEFSHTKLLICIMCVYTIVYHCLKFDDFNRFTRITVANQVGNIPLDWALGAFILQSTADLAMEQPDWFSTVIGDDSPTLFSLIAIFIILMFTAWSISKWRKPQLKTIYDLEKGRYIVTRVNRY